MDKRDGTAEVGGSDSGGLRSCPELDRSADIIARRTINDVGVEKARCRVRRRQGEAMMKVW